MANFKYNYPANSQFGYTPSPFLDQSSIGLNYGVPEVGYPGQSYLDGFGGAPSYGTLEADIAGIQTGLGDVPSFDMTAPNYGTPVAGAGGFTDYSAFGPTQFTQPAGGSGPPPPNPNNPPYQYGYMDGTTVQTDPMTGYDVSVAPGYNIQPGETQLQAVPDSAIPAAQKDPSVTDMIAKAGSAGTAVGQIVGGVVNITAGIRALRDVDIEGAETGVAEAYATRPGLATPGEFYDMQKEAYDQRIMQMRVEDINRGLATNVAAAQQYGARGLGSTLAATAQAGRATQQEALTQQRFQTQALSALAAAREREIQRREQRATFDIGMAYDNLKAEQAREAYARQQINQGIVGLASGATRAAMTFGAEQGAKVTPGEFSHENNPIDIVQNGAKIGEMTGGEYIFNPQQAKKMASEASKGNSPLHKFVRNTLNRFHKDAAKYEGK